MIEQWIEEPKTNEEFTKEDEGKTKFQNPSGGIGSRLKGNLLEGIYNTKIGKQDSQDPEDRLHDNLLKEEENVEMVGGINQGNKYKRTPCEEDLQKKIAIKDKDSSRGRGNSDIEDIFGR